MALDSNFAGKLQIRLITKEEQYAVADTPFVVSSNIVITELNTLLNELLKESQTSICKNIKFEFLINGELLRTTLQEHLEIKQISSENVIEIEYFEKHPAPEPQDCLLNDDWVSGVHVFKDRILSGSYDNTVHIWTLKGTHQVAVTGHTAAVKAVCWVDADDDKATFLSGSADQTAILWEWKTGTNIVHSVNIYKGHERNIESLCVSPAKDFFVSGGWDSVLKMWSTSTSDNKNDDEEVVAKRSKKEKPYVEIPKFTLKGHRDCISCVRYTNEDEVLTASWDHTLKLWDVKFGGIKQEIIGNKAFLCADFSALNNCIITSSADKYIRLYDFRSTEGSVIKNTFTSHTQWVQSVRWSNTDGNLFISGAYDNLVKLWDWRSPKAPLFDLTGHEDKVLCCDWSDPRIMVSGGADNTIRIYKSNKKNSLAK